MTNAPEFTRGMVTFSLERVVSTPGMKQSQRHAQPVTSPQRDLKAGMNPSTPKKLPTLLLDGVDL